jgi:KUP system potassium uptake protein
VKWFGLAPYNPIVEVQPLFVTTRRVPRLQRVALRRTKRQQAMLQEAKKEAKVDAVKDLPKVSKDDAQQPA